MLKHIPSQVHISSIFGNIIADYKLLASVNFLSFSLDDKLATVLYSNHKASTAINADILETVAKAVSIVARK